MKIIATVNQGVFLAELSTQEIDYLAGKKIGETYNSGYYNTYRSIPSGTKFNIIGAFEQIHRNEQRKGQVVTLKQTLELMLKGLEMADPLIEEPKPEDSGDKPA